MSAHDNNAAIRAALARHYLFTPLDPERLEKLVETTRVVPLRTGETLFERGDHAERFYLVVEGQIKLFRISPEGQEKVVEIMGPEQTFAEAVMFMQGQRYPVTTQAIAPSVVYGISNAAYLDILRDDPESCLQLLGDLSQRLHMRLNEIDTLTLQKATDRVVRFLLDRLPQADRASQITLPAAKHVIASRLSIQPETLSRILLQLTQAGILTVDGRRVRVQDPAKLRAQLQD